MLTGSILEQTAYVARDRKEPFPLLKTEVHGFANSASLLEATDLPVEKCYHSSAIKVTKIK